MNINTGTKSAEASVLLYSTDCMFVHEGQTKILKAFPNSRINYGATLMSVMTVICDYSMEDSLYPLLKEIYGTKTEDKALAAASVIFWKGGYTERAVFYDNREIFEVGEVRKISDEEKKEIEKARFRFRRKLFNQWNQNSSIKPKVERGMYIDLKMSTAAQWNEYMAEDCRPLKAHEIEPLLSYYRFRFLDENYLSILDDLDGMRTDDLDIIMALDWGLPLPDGRMYVYVDGDICEVNMMKWPENRMRPLYTPFEQFACWPDGHIRNIIKYGWCIRLEGEEYLYLTEPDEDEYWRKARVCRDWATYRYLQTHLPLLFPDDWSVEEPDTAAVSKGAEERRLEIIARTAGDLT